MSSKQAFTSKHYPYLPITVYLQKHTETIEALLDTGFERDIVIPEGMLTEGKEPDSYLRFTLADPGATVLAPSYLGRVEVANLGEAGSSVAIISVLGTEPIIGRNLIRRFKITLEYGRQVTIER
jgi:predicted aspartyl protease